VDVGAGPLWSSGRAFVRLSFFHSSFHLLWVQLHRAPSQAGQVDVACTVLFGDVSAAGCGLFRVTHCEGGRSTPKHPVPRHTPMFLISSAVFGCGGRGGPHARTPRETRRVGQTFPGGRGGVGVFFFFLQVVRRRRRGRAGGRVGRLFRSRRTRFGLFLGFFFFPVANRRVTRPRLISSDSFFGSCFPLILLPMSLPNAHLDRASRQGWFPPLKRWINTNVAHLTSSTGPLLVPSGLYVFFVF